MDPMAKLVSVVLTTSEDELIALHSSNRLLPPFAAPNDKTLLQSLLVARKFTLLL
jgi:hypothetical protein